MITLHNVQGHPIAINGALIERVDGGPETHVLLVSGTSYIVTESIEDVVRLHREDRAAVQALADSYPHEPPAVPSRGPAGSGAGPLRLVGAGAGAGHGEPGAGREHLGDATLHDVPGDGPGDAPGARLGDAPGDGEGARR